MDNLNSILQKHKLHSNKLNTITYVENTKEDFSSGVLKGVEFKRNSLVQSERLDESCELYIDNSLPCRDQSPNPKRLTVVTRNWEDSEEGNVFTFGSGHYIRLDEEIAFDKHEDFTIEFKLMRIDNNIAANRWILGDVNSAPYLRICIANTSGHMDIRVGDHTFLIGNINEYIPPGKWSTLAIERHDRMLRVYIDGRIVYTHTTPSVQELKIKQNSTMMNWLVSEATSFANCYLKELSVYRKALYYGCNYHDRSNYRISPQITIPESTRSVTVNWEGLGDISLVEKNTKDSDSLITLSNGEIYTCDEVRVVQNTSTNVANKFRGYTKAHNFIRSRSQYIKFTNPLQKLVPEQDFTIEATVVLKSIPSTADLWPTNYSNNYMIFGVGTASSADGYQLCLNKQHIMFSNMEKAVVYCDHNAKVGEVHHYAVSRRGDTIRLFVDGVCMVEQEYTQHINRGEFAYVGTETLNGSYMDGYILDLRVFHRAKYVRNFVCEHKPFIPYNEIPVTNNKPIFNVPKKFSLKEEVQKGKSISNVKMDIKYPTDELVVHPHYKEDDSILYLYKEGNECTDVTGGYTTMIQFNPTTWTNQNLGESTPTALEVYALGLSTKNSIGTKRPINFSRYSKMFVDVSVKSKSSTGGEVSVYVFNNIIETSGYAPVGKSFAGTEGRITVELNISSLNSHYWVAALASSNHAESASHLVVHNIWLQE